MIIQNNCRLNHCVCNSAHYTSAELACSPNRSKRGSLTRTASGDAAADGPQALRHLCSSLMTFLGPNGPLHSQPQQTSVATSEKFVASRTFVFAPHHLLLAHGGVLF